MPSAITPDYTVNVSGLHTLLRTYASDSEEGSFHATIVNDNDLLYHLILQRTSDTPKVHVRLSDRSSSSDAREVSRVIEELFAVKGAYAPKTKKLIGSTLRAGSARRVTLIIKQNVISGSYPQPGDLWL